jgi:hypothetical protein
MKLFAAQLIQYLSKFIAIQLLLFRLYFAVYFSTKLLSNSLCSSCHSLTSLSQFRELGKGAGQTAQTHVISLESHSRKTAAIFNASSCRQLGLSRSLLLCVKERVNNTKSLKWENITTCFCKVRLNLAFKENWTLQGISQTLSQEV